MKKEELLEIGLTEEQANKVFALNGVDVEREKSKAAQAKTDLAAAQEQLAARVKDLEDLKKTSGDTEAIRKQLDELQVKYDTETEQYKAQLAERDYADAMTAAIAGKGLKFSSKGAEKAFRDELKAKGLTLKDGALEGFEDFLKVQKEADPGAFAPEKPPAQIVGAVGAGSVSSAAETGSIALAKMLGKRRQEAQSASDDIMRHYMK